MRWLFRYVLPLLLVLPVGFLLLYPQLWRCIRIESATDFVRLSDSTGLYVSQTTTSRQRTQLRTHVRTAHNRIDRFWGSRRGRAILIYCPQQADYERYCIGGEGAGCSLGLPWGESYLVLGPEGNNPDVIAHELCHDELFARLGWWRVKRQIPVWFNEGLALMMDYRFSRPDVWESADVDQAGAVPMRRGPMIKLTELETTRQFFGGDYAYVMQAYQTAADEVTRWLSVVGRPGVAALTTAVAQGQPFEDVYRQLERKGRVRKRN